MHTTETTHTPTPWKLDTGPRTGSLCITSGEGSWICGQLDNDGDPQNKANAALIVRAVNSHEELVKALDGTLRLIRKAQERLCAHLHPDSSGDDRECMEALLLMFDGPEQRDIEASAQKAMEIANGR